MEMINFGLRCQTIFIGLMWLVLMVSFVALESTTTSEILTIEEPAGRTPFKTISPNKWKRKPDGDSRDPQFLPMVINSWNYTQPSKVAWRILNTKPGGLRQTRDAVVEGCSTCEVAPFHCNDTVGFGGSPDELGETTLEAMIIDGGTMNVGAVAGLRRIKEAIRVARIVLEHTKHSLLVGDAATEFAKSMGFRTESLATGNSTLLWKKWIANNCQKNFWYNVDPDPKTSCGPYKPKPTNTTPQVDDDARTAYKIGHDNHDTIGMIAIDAHGQIHAGTSTNGLTHKISGRVGDTPIPGGGAYADNAVGAATATGDGDVMMRFLPSLLAVESMRAGKSPTEAAECGIKRILTHYKDFWGAIIAVNRMGQYGAACYGMQEFPFVVSSHVKSGPKTRTETVKCLPRLDTTNVVTL